MLAWRFCTERHPPAEEGKCCPQHHRAAARTPTIGIGLAEHVADRQPDHVSHREHEERDGAGKAHAKRRVKSAISGFAPPPPADGSAAPEPCRRSGSRPVCRFRPPDPLGRCSAVPWRRLLAALRIAGNVETGSALKRSRQRGLQKWNSLPCHFSSACRSRADSHAANRVDSGIVGGRGLDVHVRAPCFCRTLAAAYIARVKIFECGIAAFLHQKGFCIGPAGTGRRLSLHFGPCRTGTGGASRFCMGISRQRHRPRGFRGAQPHRARQCAHFATVPEGDLKPDTSDRAFRPQVVGPHRRCPGRPHRLIVAGRVNSCWRAWPGAWAIPYSLMFLCLRGARSRWPRGRRPWLVPALLHERHRGGGRHPRPRRRIRFHRPHHHGRRAVNSTRERQKKAGLGRKPKISATQLARLASRPHWALATLANGQADAGDGVEILSRRPR